ncbi:MAG: DUF3048 domain-containing protein [Ilumatobacteraceae bacterium]
MPVTEASSTTSSTSSTSTTINPTTSTSSTSTSTTATIPAEPVYPLTGLPATDPALAARQTLVVKVDNAPGARPQSGLNEADIVYEEIVNDNLTRFGLVFQSLDSNPVGPCRSGRLQDIDLFGSYHHPLFAWSGGNATVTAAIRASDLVDISPSRAAVYYRTSNRNAPHNLYSSTQALRTMTSSDAAPPPQQFTYRPTGAAVQGSPSAGVDIRLDAISATWRWDGVAGLYRRWTNGQVHNDAASGQVTTNNVVVLAMQYLPGISNSPDAQTIGTGDAYVFTASNYIHAKWSKTDRVQPYTLTADDGSIVALSPGRTFVELSRNIYGVVSPQPAS